MVDYNFNAYRNYKYIDLDYTRKQQTVILIDKKEASQETLKKLIENNKLKSMHIVKDSIKIKKLNYPTKKVKAIIVATKK